MPHGAPDYSNVVKPLFTHRVDDLAEFASRVTRHQSIERRGEVLFWDNFEYGLSLWETAGSGSGNSVDLVANDGLSSPFVAKLTAGSTSGYQSRIYFNTPILDINSFGVEGRIKFVSNVTDFVIVIDYYNGSELISGYYRYNVAAEVLIIRIPDGTFPTIKNGVSIAGAGETFNFMKIVIDVNEDTYLRCWFNNTLVDLSSYGLYHLADTTAPKVVISYTVFDTNGNSGVAYIDSCILTRNEQ